MGIPAWTHAGSVPVADRTRAVHLRIMPGHAGRWKIRHRKSWHHGEVPTLTDLARNLTGLSGAELEWLHSLVSDWQLLADLSFADLILWVPLRAPAGEPNP